MIRRLRIFLLLGLTATPGGAQHAPRSLQQTPSVDLLQAYEARLFEGMPYRLLRPRQFSEDAVGNYPLVVVLHSAGGRGNDNLRQLELFPGLLAQPGLRTRYPAFVVAPQSESPWVISEFVPDLDPPEQAGVADVWAQLLERMTPVLGSRTGGGDLSRVFALLDRLYTEFPIDRNRVYVLGFSLGAFGTWSAVHAEPARFAAAVPVGGGLLPWLNARRICLVPIWAFHGARDEIVPIEIARIAFRQLQALGGNLKYTELRDQGHDPVIALGAGGSDSGRVTVCSRRTCDRMEDLWDWLFRQQR